jgi:hypothetical protein
MTPDDPRHGTTAGYYAHRSANERACGPCDNAMFRHHKQWRRDRDKGVRWTTPAQPVADHIRHLEQAGMSATAIWKAAGISRTLFYYIRNGQYSRCRITSARAVLAVQATVYFPSNLTPTQLVSGVGTRRRIRALMAIGWSHKDMRARSGVLTAVTLNQKGDLVTRSMHDRVSALYDELSMKPGPSGRTRARAAAAGYPSPLAWDDDAIDDPAAKPVGLITSGWDPAGIDESRIERRINGDRSVRLHRGESVEVVRRMLADGHNQSEIRRLTGLKPERYMAEIRATATPSNPPTQELEEVA